MVQRIIKSKIASHKDLRKTKPVLECLTEDKVEKNIIRWIELKNDMIVAGYFDKASEHLNEMYKRGYVAYYCSGETYRRFLDTKAWAEQYVSDQKARTQVSSAQKYMKENKFEDAEKCLKEALTLQKFISTQKLISTTREKVRRLAQKQHEYDARKAMLAGFKKIEDYMKSENFEEACNVYDNLIEKEDTIKYNQTLINEVIVAKRNCLQTVCRQLQSKGDRLVSQGKFEEANKFLNKALKVAHDPLISSHEFITNINRSISLCSNAQAKFLQTEANRLANEQKLTEAIQKIDEALRLANEHLTIQTLELDKMKYSKLENDMQQAKRLQTVGNKNVETNDFNEAIRSFNKALQFAHDESLIQLILKDQLNAMNKYGKFMQEEANKFVTQNKFEEALKKFDEAYEMAREAALIESIKKDKTDALNKQIKFLHQLANKQASENKFDEAQKNFEKASKVLGGDVSLIKAVVVDTARAYNLEGSLCLKQAFDLDSKEPYSDQQAKEAREKFNVAKDRFQKADVTNHTKEYEQNSQIALYKIYGDNKFNEALSLEDEAYAIYQEAKKTRNEEKYIVAQEKYQQVLDAFNEAKKCFEGGLRLNQKEFSDSVKVVSEQVASTSKVVNGMGMIRLWCIFQNNEHLYAEMVKNAAAAKNAAAKNDAS